jgi:gas vesicle protein
MTGLLLGGLVGGAAMILLAPQSGKDTRAQFQHKGIELRDQAVESVDGAVKQVRRSARQITDDVRVKAEELQVRGKDMVNEQREHLPSLVEGEHKGVTIS